MTLTPKATENNEEKKEKWLPPDSTLLQLAIRKKILETPNAKYLQLRILKKYRTGTKLEFQGEHGLGETFYASEEFPHWLIVKLYLPLDSKIEKFKNVMARKNNTSFDRLGVKLPESFVMEVEAPKLYPTEVRKQVIENINASPRKVLKSIYTPDNKNQFYLLTDKNWAVVDGEPAKDASTTIKLKKLLGDYNYL